MRYLIFIRFLLDLWNLNEEDKASSCSSVFEREWKREARNPKPSLSNAFYRSFGFSFTISAVFKAVQDVLGFVKFEGTILTIKFSVVFFFPSLTYF